MPLFPKMPCRTPRLFANGPGDAQCHDSTRGPVPLLGELAFCNRWRAHSNASMTSTRPRYQNKPVTVIRILANEPIQAGKNVETPCGSGGPVAAALAGPGAAGPAGLNAGAVEDGLAPSVVR